MNEQLPNFSLKDHHGDTHDRDALLGQKTLLSFHPLAWTKVCGDQMLSLEINRAKLAELKTVALGVSVDPTPSKKAWAESLGIDQTRLLSDFWPHGALASDLGIFREEDGFSERANVIIDEGGAVIFKKVYPISELPDMEEILGFLSQA